MRQRTALLSAGLGLMAVAACSAKTTRTGDTGATNGFSTGTQSTGTAGSTGTGLSTGPGTGGASGTASTGTGGGVVLAGVGGGSPTCDTHCSADLHEVLDCNNNVVTTCPANEGCGAKGCEAPCQAAADNKSTIGCDYYSVDPDVISEGAGACFAAYIANTWDSPVQVTVEYDGMTLDASNFTYVPQGIGQNITYTKIPSTGIPAGQVGIVFLGGTSSSIAPCPSSVTQAVNSDPSVSGTGMGNAFHISTSVPVVAYDIYPYGGGQSAVTSATLLIPTTAWDTNYIAVDAYQQSQIAASAGAQPGIAIVAQEDGTTVTINPVVAITGGNGVASAPANMPSTYSLNKGEYVQFAQPSELTGSVIQSNSPVGVWGGASCLNIDPMTAACDAAHQQIAPIKALGNEYVAVRYRNRFAGTAEETPPWRMVGAVDGTTLTYDPPTPPAGAPTTLNQGQLVNFPSSGYFSVKSQDAQHPFYMSAHMTGCETTNPGEDDCRGDPEFVNMIPPQQYLDSYVFFTDPTYPETNLVLVRGKTSTGFQDVTLDCVSGPLTGWTPIGSDGNYEYTRVDLVTGNFQPIGNCNNGRHSIQSTAPFGLVVWGWGSAATGGDYGSNGDGFYSQAVSYAYPAGASVQPINMVVVPPTPQ